ncbi:MAG: carboxypeptidase regulatory-like domain-containing protein, partial [Candidatus Hydrogenedentota bacterium]
VELHSVKQFIQPFGQKVMIRMTKLGFLQIALIALVVACSPAVEEEAQAQSVAVTTVAHQAAVAQVPGGTVTGKVVFEGKAPRMGPLPVEADPHCVKLRAGNPLLNEMLVLGEGQTMANVLVRVVSNLPKKEHAVPKEPIILSQQGCQYSPHVFAMRRGQSIKFQNPDGINHNVHLLPEKNKEMNRAMANKDVTFLYKAEHAEDVFTIKCDVHSWMRAYCAVLDHPYFAVTGTDGTFSIEGLPAGTYEIEAWHERLKTRRGEVTIGDDGGATIDFTYSKPKPKSK